MDEKRPESKQRALPDTGADADAGKDTSTRTDPRPDPGTDTAGRTGKDDPARLTARSWWAVSWRTAKEFQDDELSDRAAALTYYGVLSLFPALLVLVSLLGVMGQRVTNRLLDNIGDLAPGPVRQILQDAVTQLGRSGGTGSVLAIVGLCAALWSASGYVGAFIRTSNAVYDLPEGRPVWKVTPLRLALTVTLMLLLSASAVIVVFTGPLAERAGTTIGLGDAAITVWSVAKWPVLLVLVQLMIALLYWAAPNVHGHGFRWFSPGSVIATLIWLAASAGFAVYAAGFASYNKTYGALAGAIIFLVWLWLTNLAILLGLEFDAELARQRAIGSDGRLPTEEPYVEPRDTRKWPPRLRALRAAREKVDAGVVPLGKGGPERDAAGRA
ncbi:MULTISPECIES: YihY/virulence factor BrkB family protein [unclassified Streptomyces]|uniref:YihY/virulence factor BrkB family protein n=1 Tax=unclassified Streptomyces TaxID=2593676 RepID=UPI00224EB9BA|nr:MULTISPECIES: YihY/virulence factor BrkB family protein [unclassified Streptomyces]MCX5133915.1 YihY/virulence factor BrkB family protein [Streptomyces sp. NBC_00340]WSD80407.1 YihY/virulence factor BrkB family protein [Streptomyces sp. NBC_01558]